MAIVTVHINERPHDISCEDSQVERIEELGRQLDARARDIAKQVGAVSDTRMLVMLALWLADEVADLRSDLARTSGRVLAVADDDASIAQGIEALATRIEGIAERLERA